MTSSTSRDYRPQGTTVVPLSRGRAVLCPICQGHADWQVGPSERACSAHLGDVLTHVYVTTYDGFAPPVVVPLRPIGGSA